MFKKWVYVVVAIAAVGLIALIAKGTHLKSRLMGTFTPTIQSTPQNSSPSASQNVKSFVLVVKNKKLLSSPQILQVTEGDTVQINITSDKEDEFHLHGYDKKVDLDKDKPATLTFIAKLTGRFIYELENSKVDLGALEVSPK